MEKKKLFYFFFLKGGGTGDFLRGGGGGGVCGGGLGLETRISGDRDDRVGAKINPPKIPRASNKTTKKLWTKIKPPKKSHAKFRCHKNFQKAYI